MEKTLQERQVIALEGIKNALIIMVIALAMIAGSLIAG